MIAAVVLEIEGFAVGRTDGIGFIRARSELREIRSIQIHAPEVEAGFTGTAGGAKDDVFSAGNNLVGKVGAVGKQNRFATLRADDSNIGKLRENDAAVGQPVPAVNHAQGDERQGAQRIRGGSGSDGESKPGLRLDSREEFAVRGERRT